MNKGRDEELLLQRLYPPELEETLELLSGLVETGAITKQFAGEIINDMAAELIADALAEVA